MIGKTELRILAILQNQSQIKTIAKELDYSFATVSESISKLEEKNLVYIKIDGREKRVSPNKISSVEKLQKISQTHPHIDFPNLINGKTLEVLFYLDRPRTVNELAVKIEGYRNTVNRIVSKLIDRGIIGKNGSEYSLNEDFSVLNEIAEGFIHHMHKQKLPENVKGAILWEDHAKFLVQTGESIEQENFLETGPSRFQNYGIELLTSGKRYYFYSEKTRDLGPRDLVCHTLLIERSSRYRTYCLLLMAEENIGESLLDNAEKYGLMQEAKKLVNYLSSSERPKSGFPDWSQFSSTAKQYEVEV